jgi:hypothetical protein
VRLPEFAAYREAESRLQARIFQHFGLAPELPEQVDVLDDKMLAIEAHALLRGGPLPGFELRPTFADDTLDIGVAPEIAEATFMHSYRRLFAR